MSDKNNYIMKFEKNSKQPILLFLVFALMLSCLFIVGVMLSSGVSSGINSGSSLGDVNTDGEVNSADALLVLKIAVGEEKSEMSLKKTADVDVSGGVDSNDALLILQYSSRESRKIGKFVLTKAHTKLDNQGDVSVIDSSQSSQSEEAAQPAAPVSSEEIGMEGYKQAGSGYRSAYVTNKDDLHFAARIGSSWTDTDGTVYYEILVTVKNNAERRRYDSSVEINFSDDVEVKTIWGCSAEADSTLVTLKTKKGRSFFAGEAYNCGMIVASQNGSLSLSSLSVEEESE